MVFRGQAANFHLAYNSKNKKGDFKFPKFSIFVYFCPFYAVFKGNNTKG